MQLVEAWRKVAPMLNPRAETFSTVLTFMLGSVVRLASSLILTRLLFPEAYGVIAILMSVLFMIEMLSDIGVIGLTIRHERGDDPLFLNTLWTIRVLRCGVNASILVVGAPWLAQWLGSADLENPLRVLALYFAANAIESMGFALALRHRRSPVVNYINLANSVVATVFCIVYSYFARDYWGMVYAALLERTLNAIASHFLYPHLRPRWAWDRDAVREIFAFARYVLPTSVLTMALSQFERVLFLRLFDLRLMGMYGVAGSVSGPAESLCVKISHMVLYPRYATALRETPERLRAVYYDDNRKPMLLLFGLPALLGGAGQHLIDLLYDPRYAQAGFILQCFMVRAVLLSFLRSSEQLLTAIGLVQVQLHANVLRAVLLAPLLLLGHQLYGLPGFMVGLALEPLAALVYLLWRQHRRQLLSLSREAFHAGVAVAVWFAAWAVAELAARAWGALMN